MVVSRCDSPCSVLLLLLWHRYLFAATGFTPAFVSNRGGTYIPLFSTTVVSDVTTIVDEIDNAINNLESSSSTILPSHVNDLFLRLEETNPTPHPCRSKTLLLGEWNIWYTDCPPPSNGQLGPFVGAVSQVLREEGTYENLLSVAPRDWLSSTLKGVWEEWDGVILEEATSEKDSEVKDTTEQDLGASHTKVTFQSVEICVFGFRLFQMKFPPDTCRIWRTTYLDDEIRVLRAGRTGKLEDESIFYTKRTPKKKLSYD